MGDLTRNVTDPAEGIWRVFLGWGVQIRQLCEEEALPCRLQWGRMSPSPVVLSEIRSRQRHMLFLVLLFTEGRRTSLNSNHLNAHWRGNRPGQGQIYRPARWGNQHAGKRRRQEKTLQLGCCCILLSAAHCLYSQAKGPLTWQTRSAVMIAATKQ